MDAKLPPNLLTHLDQANATLKLLIERYQVLTDAVVQHERELRNLKRQIKNKEAELLTKTKALEVMSEQTELSRRRLNAMQDELKRHQALLDTIR